MQYLKESLTGGVLAGLSLALCLNPTAQGDTPHSQPVFPYPVETTVLDNGLTVITVRSDTPGILSYYTIVRTGSRNEVEPGLSGFAHFFEHMMFRGTPRNSSEQYNAKMKALGADSNAFTTDDWTAYHTTASADALATVVELEADRFQNLSYDQAAFQKEARAVLGEYNKIASSPLLLMDETMQDAAYDRHTYKHTTIGFLKDIVDMPNQYEYSRKFFDRWYRPDNCIVLAVGDVRHNEVVELARRHYIGWKRGAATVEIPAEPAQTAERRRDLAWKGVTLPYLYIGYHVPGFDSKSRNVAALDVLSEALFSQVSPLYRKLVLEEAHVETINAGAQFHRDPALFTIMARLRDPADLATIEQEIYKALVQRGRQAAGSKQTGRDQVAHALWIRDLARFHQCGGPRARRVPGTGGRPAVAKPDVRNVRAGDAGRRATRRTAVVHAREPHGRNAPERERRGGPGDGKLRRGRQYPQDTDGADRCIPLPRRNGPGEGCGLRRD